MANRNYLTCRNGHPHGKRVRRESDRAGDACPAGLDRKGPTPRRTREHPARFGVGRLRRPVVEQREADVSGPPLSGSSTDHTSAPPVARGGAPRRRSRDRQRLQDHGTSAPAVQESRDRSVEAIAFILSRASADDPLSTPSRTPDTIMERFEGQAMDPPGPAARAGAPVSPVSFSTQSH
ncbi:MAG: hypothetical protein IPG84_06660 [Betaproteobacteria bacterium]|nr:hypothetical protein [Betaproteobacteria bacterium]